MEKKVNLKEKFGKFDQHWSPKIVAELNGQMVKVVKCQGEYPWHSHAAEDELFMVIAGQLEIRFRDSAVLLEEGELYVVPKGIEHSPAAKAEAHVLMFEPGATRNTGNVDHEYTIEAGDLDRI